MPRSSNYQSLKVGVRNGLAWIGTRTFDGIETNIETNLENLDLQECRFLRAQLEAVIPEVEAAEREKSAKRLDELKLRRQRLEQQIGEVAEEMARLGGAVVAQASAASVTEQQPCRECGCSSCDPEGVGHYRG